MQVTPVMTYPLIALAVCACAVGLLFGPTGWFEHHIMGSYAFEGLGHPEHAPETDLTVPLVGTLVVEPSACWLASSSMPSPARFRAAWHETLKPLYTASLNKFYIDELYGMVVVGPLRLLATISAFLDEWFLHGALVRGTAWMPRLLGRQVLASLQNGLIQYYAAVTAPGRCGPALDFVAD